MTAKDKTADQLVASIRKSKSATVANKASAQQTPSPKPATGADSSGTKSPRQTGFSHGRRVWPD